MIKYLSLSVIAGLAAIALIALGSPSTAQTRIEKQQPPSIGENAICPQIWIEVKCADCNTSKKYPNTRIMTLSSSGGKGGCTYAGDVNFGAKRIDNRTNDCVSAKNINAKITKPNGRSAQISVTYTGGPSAGIPSSCSYNVSAKLN